MLIMSWIELIYWTVNLLIKLLIYLSSIVEQELLDGDFLRTRSIEIPIVTGETLTSAIIVKKIEAQKVDKVFLASANSRVGQAVATYLCQHGVTVVVCVFCNKFYYWDCLCHWTFTDSFFRSNILLSIARLSLSTQEMNEG